MKKRWLPLWVIPALIGMAVGTVWLRLKVVRTTYVINEMDTTIRNLGRERDRMELKLANLKSPRRLEGLAKAKFNLAAPKPDQVVYLK